MKCFYFCSKVGREHDLVILLVSKRSKSLTMKCFYFCSKVGREHDLVMAT